MKEEIVKLKEYNELFCSRPSCHALMNIEQTLTMIDGYRGYCTCPVCGHRTKVHKVRPNDKDYNVDKNGTRTRKEPKLKLSKKERRKINKEMRK